jgi:large subunit ribosomal protein L30
MAENTQSHNRKLRVTLVKSPIGNQHRHKLTVRALGLDRLNKTIIHPDNPSVRGMIFKVNHLVHVEEVSE